MQIKKYDILLVDLNPTVGSEQRGIRPCLVLQNNEANKFSNTTVISIISSRIKIFPHTLIIEPSPNNNLEKKSRIDLLQVRTIDKKRIVKKIGTLDQKYKKKVLQKICVGFDLEDLFE